MATDRLPTKRLPSACDCLAPDGSEIRLLVAGERGSCVHCTLPPGAVSLAVRHRSVEEIWYVLAGQGQMWRRLDGAQTSAEEGSEHDTANRTEEVVELSAGMSLTIPRGAHFQFRNPGAIPLEIVLVTMPPWPGEDEAVRVADHWPVAAQEH